MEAKHTKGNWFIEKPWKGTINITADKNGFVIAQVTSDCITHFIGNTNEAEANAKLIAAAPELLDALKEIYSFVLNPEGRYLDVILNKCESAIEKATE